MVGGLNFPIYGRCLASNSNKPIPPVPLFTGAGEKRKGMPQSEAPFCYKPTLPSLLSPPVHSVPTPLIKNPTSVVADGIPPIPTKLLEKNKTLGVHRPGYSDRGPESGHG